MNPYIIDSDSLNMNPQVDSFDSREKRSIQGSKCSNSSPREQRKNFWPWARPLTMPYAYAHWDQYPTPRLHSHPSLAFNPRRGDPSWNVLPGQAPSPEDSNYPTFAQQLLSFTLYSLHRDLLHLSPK